MAYNTALLTGVAMAGKLRSFDEHFSASEQSNGASALLGALFRLKRRGIEMTIERVSLH